MKQVTKKDIDSFRTYLIKEEKSPITVEKYIRDVLALKKWLQQKNITKEIIIDYKNDIIKTFSPKSVNSMLSSLNSFFSFMNWHECRVKTLKIQKRIFADDTKELSKKEYQKLLGAAQAENKKLYFLMQTICSTGIRVSELRFITVDAVKRKQATINCKGKMRVVILPLQLCSMLRQYIKEEKILGGSVFVTRNGNPLDRSNIWRMLKSLCSAAGVEEGKVFPHNLRHLFARMFYSLEKDIVRLSDVLGHSSINTTRIYTMETSSVHRKQIQKLGLLMC